jgi:hypothetical protein
MPCLGLGLSGRGFCDGTDTGTSATLYRTLVRLSFGESEHKAKTKIPEHSLNFQMDTNKKKLHSSHSTLSITFKVLLRQPDGKGQTYLEAIAMVSDKVHSIKLKVMMAMK